MKRLGTYRTALVAIGFMAAWVFAPTPAGANPFDLYGVGSRNKAMGDTGVATARDFTAAHYNPSGIGLAEDITLSLDYAGALPKLEINGIAQDNIEAAGGFTFGLGLPVALNEVYEHFQAAFAVALFIPDRRLAKIALYPAVEPRLFRYDNNAQRFVITPVFALRVWKGVSIGGGVTFLGEVSGDGLSYDIFLRGAIERARARIDTTIKPRLTPVLGVSWDPYDWLGFGYSFRGSSELSLALDIATDVEITAVDVQGMILISLLGSNFWMPQRHALGAHYEPIKNLNLTAELVWARWSRMPNPSANLVVNMDIGTEDVPIQPYVAKNYFTDGELYGPGQLNFSDVFSPHLGVEYTMRAAPWLAVDFRGGYFYEPSPAPTQSGILSLLDSDRHSLSAGAGLSFEKFTDVLEKPLDVDFFFQYSRLVHRGHSKDLYTNPQPFLESQGNIYALGLTTAVRF